MGGGYYLQAHREGCTVLLPAGTQPGLQGAGAGRAGRGGGLYTQGEGLNTVKGGGCKHGRGALPTPSGR